MKSGHFALKLNIYPLAPTKTTHPVMNRNKITITVTLNMTLSAIGWLDSYQGKSSPLFSDLLLQITSIAFFLLTTQEQVG